MVFIEATTFSQHLSGYLDDEEYRNLQSFLCKDPKAGDVIQGTGGLRKIRWRHAKRGKGKRGGTRVIYFYRSKASQIYFLSIYDKDEMADLTAEQKKVLKHMLGDLFYD